MKRKILFGLMLWGLGSPTVGWSAALSLKEYLRQVAQENFGIQGSQQASLGAKERSEEGRLLVTPTLFAMGSLTHDERPTTNPSFLGTLNKTRNYSLGVNWQTTVGLNTKLTYNLTHTAYENATLLPQPRLYDSFLTMELTQSLWRNFFGAETQANQEMLEAQALSISYQEAYQRKLQMIDADVAYWRLVLTRKAVAVRKEVFERAEKIADWARRRSQLHLADRADLLQAQAALQMRRLEQQTSADDERQAARHFNAIRRVKLEHVTETLETLHEEKLVKLTVPTRLSYREDVKAAEEGSRAAIANSVIGLQRDTPVFELYATFGLDGKNKEIREAWSDSWTTKYPYTVVGLRFTAPLDPWLVMKSRSGYEKEKGAADLKYQQKLFEQEEQWTDLIERFHDVKERLKLALDLEIAQKEKLLHEQTRLSQGRTTTYQVLLFEQDYAQAQLQKLQAMAEILQVYAQLKTFGEI